MAIGSIRLSDRVRDPIQDRANPAAFGEGVARALQGLGKEIGGLDAANKDLELAEKQRQKNLAGYATEQEFVRAQGEIQRDVIDLRQKTIGPGYTDLAYGTAKDRLGQFAAAITDPEMRAKYAPRIEEFLQNTATGSYQDELTITATRATNDFNAIALHVDEQVRAGLMSRDKAAEQLANLVENVPVPEDARLELAIAADILVDKADLAFQAQEAATMWVETHQGIKRQYLTESEDITEPGHMKLTKKITTQGMEDFLSGIDPRLQPAYRQVGTEFIAAMELIGIEADTGIRSAQQTQLDETFMANVEQKVSELAPLVKNNSMTVEEATAELQRFLDTSQSSAEITDAVAKFAMTNLELAAFGREANLLAGAADPRSNFADPNLPIEAARFFGAIDATESKGAYNVMYGGSTFSDFSWHPNITHYTKEGDPSTAAGRYQFIYSTWMRAANALGLTDFSPASQDKAAWWLAQDDYAKNSGGRSLAADLASGDQGLGANIRRSLMTTWEGFGNISDEKFNNIVFNGEGSMAGLMADPRFDHLPQDQRNAIMTDALTSAQVASTARAAADTASYNARISDAITQIENGTFSQTKINVMDESGFFKNNEDRERVQDAYNTKYAEELAAGELQDNLANNPAFSFTADDPGREAMSSMIKFNGGYEGIKNRDEAVVQNLILPTIDAANYADKGVSTQLAKMLTSSNQADVDYASNVINQIEARNSEAAKTAFGDDTIRLMQIYNTRKGVMSATDLAEYMTAINSPPNKAAVESALAVGEKFIADNPDQFAISHILSEVGDPSIWSAQSTILDIVSQYSAETDYKNLFLGNLAQGMTTDDAADTAEKQLVKNWGVSNATGQPIFMKFPPEYHTQKYDGGHDYMIDQLRQDQGLGPDAQIYLTSDAQTEAEIAKGIPPSYGFTFQNAEMDFDVIRWENSTGDWLPARQYFEVTPAMTEQLVTKIKTQDAVMKASDILSSHTMSGEPLHPTELAFVNKAFKDADTLAASLPPPKPSWVEQNRNMLLRSMSTFGLSLPAEVLAKTLGDK